MPTFTDINELFVLLDMSLHHYIIVNLPKPNSFLASSLKIILVYHTREKSNKLAIIALLIYKPF